MRNTAGEFCPTKASSRIRAPMLQMAIRARQAVRVASGWSAKGRAISHRAAPAKSR
jgi:hypothetical protein